MDNRNKPWPHSPAIIARVEYYDDPTPYPMLAQECALRHRLEATTWDVMLDGRTMGFATYEDAELVARFLVDPRNAAARQDWREGIGCEADYLGKADEQLCYDQLAVRTAQARAAFAAPYGTIADELGAV